MIRKKWLLATLVAVLISIFSYQEVVAANFDYRITTSYKVSKDNVVTARTIIDVTNNVSRPTPSTIVLPVAGEATKIEAAYQDGGNINATYSADNRAIRLETNKSQSGNNRKWSVVVNYQVDALQKFGATSIVSISPLNYGDLEVKQESVSVAADLTLGVAISRGPKPASSRIVAGQQVLTWQNKKGTLKDAVGVLFGESGVADVRIEQQLKNDGWWWRDVTLTLPPDTNQQTVFVEEITPTPSAVNIDVDGNILVSFNLRPQQTIQVKARLMVVVNNFTYALDSQLPLSDTPSQITERYGALNDVWKSSGLEVEIDDQKSADAIEAIYRVVSDQQIEASNSLERSRPLSDNLVGELRNAGIPSRVVLGHVFGDGGGLFAESQPHAWVEAYAAGVGWITLDPIFEKSGEYFGTTDVQRVGLVLRGINPDFPPEQLEATTVSYTDNDIPQTPDMIPELSATNHMILPGLAIRSINIELPKGVIVDGNGIKAGDSSARLVGSLAPLQTVKLRDLSFGAGAFSSAPVVYGFLSNGDIENPLAETALSVNYLPMIIILSLVLVVLLVRFIRSRRKPESSKSKRSREAVTFASEDSGGNIEQDDLLAQESVAKSPPPAPPPPDYRNAPTSPQTAAPVDDTMSTSNGRPDQHDRPHRQRIQ